MLFAVELVHRFLQPARRLQGVNVKERQRQSSKKQRHQHGNPRFLQNDLQVYLEDAEDGTEQSHRRPHRQHIDADEAVGAGAAGVLADDEAGHDGNQRIDAGGEADADTEQQDERQGDEEIVVQFLHDAGRFIAAGGRRGGLLCGDNRRGERARLGGLPVKMELALQRRIANQPLGAALQMQGERAALRLRQAEAQFVAVNLLFAEKIILMTFALRQWQCQRFAVQFRLQAVAVQIIAVRHLIMHMQHSLAVGFRLDQKRLILRQNHILRRLEQRRAGVVCRFAGSHFRNGRSGSGFSRRGRGKLCRRDLQRPSGRRITNDILLAALRLQGEGFGAVVMGDGNGRRVMPDLRRAEVGVVLFLRRRARLFAVRAAERGLVGIQIIAVGETNRDLGAVTVCGRALMNFRLEDFFRRQRVSVRGCRTKSEEDG